MEEGLLREIANPFEAVQWQAALGDECFVQKLRERLESAATSVGFSPVTTYSMMYDALGRCVKRSLTSGPTTYYIYDGEKPILEYDGGGGSAGVNLYGKGIDEIVMRIAIGADSNWWTYYPQQNHEGSVTLLTYSDGSVLERYRYDAFGAPTIYDQNWNVRTNTIYDNRFLFTGREYALTYRSTNSNTAFNFYEYRARAYNPKIGRFMSEDPKLFVRHVGLGPSAADWTFSARPDEAEFNLFRYCGNDPIDFTDPTGTYGEGTGWSPDQWKSFNDAQQAAAQQVSNAVAKLNKALGAGKDSKAFKSESKAFEKTFGKGTGTAENMARKAGELRTMLEALRDDGSKGYYANAVTNADMVAAGRPGANGMTYPSDRKSIYLNVERGFSLNALKHETAHNAGLTDVRFNGYVPYRYGQQPNQDAFVRLPIERPDLALENADTLADYAR